MNGAFVSELDTSEIAGASDVWIGAGFHQANAIAGEITRFEDFTVWPLDAAQIPVALATPAAPATPGAATPIAPAATPVASAGPLARSSRLGSVSEPTAHPAGFISESSVGINSDTVG